MGNPVNIPAGIVTQTVATSGATGAAGTVLSTTYTGLTGGTNPVITQVTGSTAISIVTGYVANTGLNTGYVSVAVSGATTVAASDSTGSNSTAASINVNRALGRVYVFNGLNPGSNTFTPQYRVTAGTGTFLMNHIVLPSPNAIVLNGGIRTSSGAEGSNANGAVTTSSASFVSLGGGPAISLFTGTQALVCVSAIAINSSAIGQSAVIAPAVSGASSIAAADAVGIQGSTNLTTQNICLQGFLWVTGLTQGLNTFTLQYRVSGDTWTFSNRTIAVIPF